MGQPNGVQFTLQISQLVDAGSNGKEGSNSIDSLHSLKHALHCSSLRYCCWGSISWVDQCWSEAEDQHIPEGTEDASCEATEESEGEEQSTLLASPQDKSEPVEVCRAGVTGHDLCWG